MRIEPDKCRIDLCRFFYNFSKFYLPEWNRPSVQDENEGVLEQPVEGARVVAWGGSQPMQKNSSILIGHSFYLVNSFEDSASRAIGRVLKKIRVGGSQALRTRFSDLVFLLIFH